MSLSPIALGALRAALADMSATEVDLHGDVLARGMEVVDREGRLVGAFQAQELLRLRARAAELEEQLAALTAQGQVLRESRQAGAERGEVGDGEHYATVHHAYLTPRDLPPIGGAQ
ncbi:hypothetical protein [Streptomyces sp. BK340]|uniref:hypothetical protein n=1 Tax=Streptomyces sp. BK340 TaxID=2572903 RepID=UPI0011A3006B|nr:hypothetical protein [Streptomyces sp. BK340]TVZ96456.1 hypothetical protein FB157_103367 [Streptomyces sp. BK340]